MEEKPKHSPWLLWLVIGLVLPVAYVLSMAPVILLVRNGRLPRVLSIPYRPLIWFTPLAPEALSESLVWYNSFWGV